MEFIPVKTRPMLPPKDDVYPVLDKYLPALKEGDVLLITSKILGIHHGRCVKIKQDTLAEKDALVMREADYYIKRRYVPHDYSLTIKNNAFVAAAGIDKSNGNGYYVMWPRHVNKLLEEICVYLKKKHKITKLAVIAVDSHTLPLRYGAMGISIGFFGLEPIKDYRGMKDIFGRELKFSRANIVDTLAVMGNFLMGEANETTPLLIIRQADFIQFTNRQTTKELWVPIKEDVFYPILKRYHERKNKISNYSRRKLGRKNR